MTPTPAVELDWAAYWRAFQDLHGGDPVRVGGRLLFRDGWTYSAYDHAGPEWPPPREPGQLRALQKEYWSAHRWRVNAEREDLVRRADALDGEARARSVGQLFVRVAVAGDGGAPTTASLPLDTGAMRARAQHLKDLLDECDAALKALGGPPRPGTPPASLADALPPRSTIARG